MNAQNSFLRGFVLGFMIGVSYTLMCQMAFAMADGEIPTCKDDQVDRGCRLYKWGKWFYFQKETIDGNGEFSTASVPPCEKKMVEAMKAIDPFIEREPHTFIDDLMIRTPQQRLRDEIERLNKRDSALWTWENVMKECVK